MYSRMRVNSQPLFILYVRAYRDTSVLIEGFSQEHGRMSGILRGVRSQKSPFKGLARPFLPLVMSWSGQKSKLMTIHSIEPSGCDYWFTGKVLMSGFYLNELLMRLLQPYDPHPEIYTLYADTLANLHQHPNEIEPILRVFEFDLLKALGYGLSLDKTHDTQEAVVPEYFYSVKPECGVAYFSKNETSHLCWRGRSLIDIEHRNFSDKQTRQEAKKLIRLLLKNLLGNQTLKSRDYFFG